MTAHTPTTPIAASGSADSLVHRVCAMINQHGRCDECPRHTDTQYGRGIIGCYAVAEEVIAEIRKATPALSARPNEADIQEALGCLNAVANEQSGGNWRWAKAIIEQWNEADAPSGQAVAFDDLQTTILAEAIRIGVPLKVREAKSITERVMERYFVPPPPSQVGEADGVREKYRAVTLEDATNVRRKYVHHMGDFTLDHNEAMQLALQSIGAVVPKEGK